MRPRICICCGEPMLESGNTLSRNPHVCASCSSLADGMEDSTTADGIPPAPEPALPIKPDPHVIAQRAIEVLVAPNSTGARLSR